MPTYEYKCDACGHAFEKFQSITSAPIKKCPQCGKSKVRRLIGTGAGLLFKGSGFYITDYRPDSYNNAAKADAPAAASTNGDTKPAESKPAATAGETTATPKPETKSEPKPQPKSSSAKKQSKSPRK